MKTTTRIFFLLTCLTSLSQIATASTSSEYLCQPAADNSNSDTYTIHLSGKKMTMITEGDSSKHSLSLDPTYAPRLNKSFSRYRVEGDDTFLTGGESYDVGVLVSRAIIDGEGKGSMKIQARGEGFFNDHFSCVQK